MASPFTHPRSLLALALLQLMACSSPDSDAFGASGGGIAGTAGFAGKAGAGGQVGIAGGVGVGGAGSGNTWYVSGAGGTATAPRDHITAAEWDDNQNFEAFQEFLLTQSPLTTLGAALASDDRVVLDITAADGAPVADALVTIHDATTTYLSAPTGSDGRLLFFPTHDGVPTGTEMLTVTVQTASGTSDFPMSLTEAAWSVTLVDSTAPAVTGLDLALVLDATADMHPVIDYLAAKLPNVADPATLLSKQISAQFGAVLYKDDNETYLTKTHPFTADLNGISATLRAEAAGGGGDYPEAIHAGLEALLTLDWRTDNTARIAFVVFDAPPHEAAVADLLSYVDVARRAGIKLYPINTGVAESARYFARLTAQWTASRFLFTTQEPEFPVYATTELDPVPCYRVQTLEQIMTRIVRSELQGAPVPTDVATVIRLGGVLYTTQCSNADGSSALPP